MQIHDFNPGITPSGLFWTIPVSPHTVQINLREAHASLHLSNVKVEDYHDIVNALKDGPSVPATASFHVRWSGVNKRVHVHDTANMFDLEAIEDHAIIEWRVSEAGFTFVSDPAHTSASTFAEIGSERNGVFF